ncbi:hypothetical protein ABPG72_008452 [Tetrahymena utriculariae]
MTDWKKIVKETFQLDSKLLEIDFKDFGQDSAKNLCEALGEEKNIEKIEFKISRFELFQFKIYQNQSILAFQQEMQVGSTQAKGLVVAKSYIHQVLRLQSNFIHKFQDSLICQLNFLSSHNIGKDGMTFLSKNLKGCSQLVEFNMQIGGLLIIFLNLIYLKKQLNRFNYIKKEGSSGLKQILENFTQLERIFLSIRQQFDQYFRRLNLYSKNDIGEQGAIQIGQGLKKLHKLKSFSIEIGQNFISHEGVKGLCDGLKDLQHIEELSFSIRNMNNIGPQGSQEIGKLIQKLHKLETFSFTIYNNQILQEGIQGIGQGLGCCYNLQNLSMEIGNNSIGSQGAEQLGKGLNKCHNLKDLHLIIFSGNEIGYEGCIGLAFGFQNLLKLENLYLSIGCNNKIGSAGVISLGENISKCLNLRLFRLEFYQNEITQDGILKFGSKIRYCSQLYYFQFTITDINLETQQLFVRKLKKADNLVKVY